MEYQKKPVSRKLSNGHNRSFSGKSIYDGVFSGLTKTRASPVTDYGDIFSGSGGSSIPILEVPELNERKVSVEVRSSKLDYSMVFGGFDDFGVSHEQLITKSKKRSGLSFEEGRGRSKPGVQPEISPSKHQHENKVSSRESSQRSADKVEHVKHNKTNVESETTKGKTIHPAQLHSVPSYFTHVNNNLSPMKTEGTKAAGSSVKNYTGLMEEKDHKQTGTQFSYVDATTQPPTSGNSFDSRKKSDQEGCSLSFDASDIGLSMFNFEKPPPSSLPRVCINNSGNSERLVATDFGVSKSNYYEDAADTGSPPYFDVEVDVNSVAAASAAAVKKAIEEAQERITFAKELMERKKEGFHKRMKPSFDAGQKIEGRRKGKTMVKASKVQEMEILDICDKGDSSGQFSCGVEETKLLNPNRLGMDHMQDKEEPETAQELDMPKKIATKLANESVNTLEACTKIKENVEIAAEKEADEGNLLIQGDCSEEIYSDMFMIADKVNKQKGDENKIRAAQPLEETTNEKLSQASEVERCERKLEEIQRLAEIDVQTETHHGIVEGIQELREEEEIQRPAEIDVQTETHHSVVEGIQELREEEEIQRPAEIDVQTETHHSVVEGIQELRKKEETEAECPQQKGNGAKSETEHTNESTECETNQRNACKIEDFEGGNGEGSRTEENHEERKDISSVKQSEGQDLEAILVRLNKFSLSEEKEETANLMSEPNQDLGSEKRKEETFHWMDMETEITEPTAKFSKQGEEIEVTRKFSEVYVYQDDEVAMDCSEASFICELVQEKTVAVEMTHEEKELNEVKLAAQDVDTAMVSNDNDIKSSSSEVSCEQMPYDHHLEKSSSVSNSRNVEELSCKSEENSSSVDETDFKQEAYVNGSGFRPEEMWGSNRTTMEAANPPSFFEGDWEVGEASESTEDIDDDENNFEASSVERWIASSKLNEAVGSPCTVAGDSEIEEVAQKSRTSQSTENNEDKQEGDENCFRSSLEEVLVDSGKEREGSQPSITSEGDERTFETTCSIQNDEENRHRTLTEEEKEAILALQKEVETEDKLHRNKIDEERKKKREERRVVERAIREARERAFVEARGRAALEKANTEARRREKAEARGKSEKISAEVNDKSSAEKASMESKLRAQRAAVERATAEARDRALEKSLSEKAFFQARRQADKYSKPAFSDSHYEGSGHSKSSKHSSSSNKKEVPSSSEIFDGANTESAHRFKAKLERHQQTTERAAKILAEKNMRDYLAQKEQAERNRLAETLDAQVKRWSNGKETNLRALLSTLQFILEPESGWQAVSLTDLITATAVKKAYRKATLCVHPDKLQQRGASTQQKYTCEKVFDLLKDAWNKFSADER